MCITSPRLLLPQPEQDDLKKPRDDGEALDLRSYFPATQTREPLFHPKGQTKRSEVLLQSVVNQTLISSRILDKVASMNENTLGSQTNKFTSDKFSHG